MASPIDIKVLSTTAMKMVFEELSPRFERETGNRLAVTLGPSLVLEKRVGEDEAADMAILGSAGVKDLIARGKILAGSAIDIARSAIGVAVRKGAPRPDLSSAESFKCAMLAAKSIACSKPVGGGASGAHMAKVFEQLGIAEAMHAKAKYGAGGAAGLAGLVVQRGEADIGIQQMAELIAVDGIDVVGPLPPMIVSAPPENCWRALSVEVPDPPCSVSPGAPTTVWLPLPRMIVAAVPVLERVSVTA